MAITSSLDVVDEVRLKEVTGGAGNTEYEIQYHLINFSIDSDTGDITTTDEGWSTAQKV